MSHFRLFIAFIFFPGPLAFLFLLLRYISSINIRAGFRRCQFPQPPSYEEATRGGVGVRSEGRANWAAEPERESARARRLRVGKEETSFESAAPPAYDAAGF